MNKKIIGFDIDDTLTDCRKFEYDLLQEWCVNIEKIGPYTKKINENGLSLEDRYPGLDSNTLKRFNNFYFPRMVSSAPFRQHIPELFIELKKLDYMIYIITRRDQYYEGNYSGAMMKEDTLSRFERASIKYDKIFFGCYNKKKIMEENDVSVLVEDSPSNIFQVATKYPCICMDNPYNLSITGKNIYHVDSLNPSIFLPVLEKIFNNEQN